MVFTLSAGIFAGCGSSSSSEVSSKPSDTSATASSPSGEKVTLNFWHKDTGVKGDLFKKYADEFMKENPDIKVAITQARSDAYKEKLPIAFNGSDQPDVFFTWGGSWLKSFVDAGHVMDLTNKVDTANFHQTALKNAMYDQKLYGLPLGIDIGLVFYNKEIFKKYDIQVPKTFEELMATCDKLTANKVIPFVLANQPKWPGSFYFMYMVDRIGGKDAFDNAVNRTGSFAAEPFVKAGEYLQQMVKKKAFNPGFNGVAYDSGPGRQLLYTEKAAMLVLSNTFVNLMRTEAPEFEQKMGVFPFPTFEGGKGDASSLVGIAAPEWSVSAKTKYPEQSLKLVQFMASKGISQEYADTTGSQSARSDITSKDSFVNMMEKMVADAKSIQMVYDQTLPPELVDAHLSTTQEILGLTMTPQEAADKMEAKAKKVYGK